jgi:hypothetical protein
MQMLVSANPDQVFTPEDCLASEYGLAELDNLQLTLVGGGNATVVFS